MITKSRINRSKFQVAFISQGMNFFGNFFLLQSPTMRKSSSDMHQDFALSSFDNQVGTDFWKKCVEGFTSKLAVVNSAFLFRNARFSFLLIVGATKFITNPIHDLFISIRNFDVGVVVQNWSRSKFGFSVKKTYKKATFSIYKSCEICKFCISHKTPLFKTDQYRIDPYICTA